MHHQHIVYIYIYISEMMIIQATNFTVMLLACLCIDTLSQKKKKLIKSCQNCKNLHYMLIFVWSDIKKETCECNTCEKWQSPYAYHTNVHNFLFPFSRLNVYAVWVHLASYIWKSCLRVKTPCCIVSSYSLMRVEAIWIQCGKGGPPPLIINTNLQEGNYRKVSSKQQFKGKDGVFQIHGSTWSSNKPGCVSTIHITVYLLYSEYLGLGLKNGSHKSF